MVAKKKSSDGTNHEAGDEAATCAYVIVGWPNESGSYQRHYLTSRTCLTGVPVHTA